MHVWDDCRHGVESASVRNGDSSRYKISQSEQTDTLTSVIQTLDNVSFIDEDDKDIPYHARQDSRPFTYGSVVENTGKLECDYIVHLCAVPMYNIFRN